MEIKVSKKYLRISPRKVRLVADLIRNSYVEEALARLSVLQKRSAIDILKLLNSAKTIALDKEAEESKLYIKGIQVDQGPVLKRRRYRSRGRANPILKRSSHIKLILDEKHK